MRFHRYWFAAKTFGIGAGLPICWEGWATLGLFVALISADVSLAPPGPWRWAGLAVLAGAMMMVAALTTEGGWRWRWGRR